MPSPERPCNWQDVGGTLPSWERPCNLQDAEGILAWQQVHSVLVAGLDMCLVFLPERADSHPVALGSTPEQSRYLLQEDFGEQRCTRMKLSLLDAGALMPVWRPELPGCYSSTASHPTTAIVRDLRDRCTNPLGDLSWRDPSVFVLLLNGNMLDGICMNSGCNAIGCVGVFTLHAHLASLFSYLTTTLRPMAQFLAQNHLLTIFLVVGLGAFLGAIRFGPLRFGAAGALFVGLLVSAYSPQAGQGTAIIQQIGLAFFVYTVGIAAGSTFFSDLRKQTSLLGSAAIICVVGAVVATIGGHFLGLGKGLVTGLYTGALTAAPALDAATRVSGDPQAAVGYAFGYPIGVIVGIVVVTMTVTILTRKITAWREGRVRMSYLQREGRTRVLIPGEELRTGDLVVLVGGTSAIAEVVEQLGTQVSDHLADDRSDVAFERIVVSSPDVAGRAIVELNLPTRFGATITRVRRGDLDLLARDDLKLNLGDHAAVVVPQEELDNVQSFLGDSERRVSEVDGMAFGIGMVLGMALGAIPFPMFGGATFQLGSAAGPLIVGMLLGALRRTGPLVWTLSASANITIRSVGLMLFLAALGLNAGPELVDLMLRPEGWKAAILATIIVAVCCAAQAIAGRYLGLSAPRTAGAVAGFLGQPAVLQAADARVADERIEAAYATLFAFAIIVKIFLVPFIWTL